MNIRKNENNNSRNIYREMFVMRPFLKKMLEIYKDAENVLIIKMYADYFKK